MASRVSLARAGAVVGVSLLVTLGAALPANADDAATGKLTGHNTDAFVVKLKDKGDVHTTLFELASENSKLNAYCVELNTSVNMQFPDMQEVGWDKYPTQSSPFNKNRGKIKWVLQHSYPAVETDAIAAALPKDVQLSDGLSKEEAITATQTVIWKLSDEVDLDRDNPLPRDKGSAADVLAVYDYLLKNAQDVAEPTPGLEISPAEATGTPGKKIGPFKISTTAAAVELTSKLPEGVKLVDAKGNAIDAKSVKNGSELFLDVPSSASAGEATLSASAVADLSVGRLFIGKDYKEHPTQSMILAKSSNTKLQAGAKASWKAATAPSSSTPAVPIKIPAGDNPNVAAPVDNTSSATPYVLGGGGALVLLAGGGLFLARRRKAASSED